MEYKSPYMHPIFLLVDPLPLPQVRRWWAAHLQIFFEIFYFSRTWLVLNIISLYLKLRWEILSAWNTFILVILDYKIPRKIYLCLLEIFTRDFA